MKDITADRKALGDRYRLGAVLGRGGMSTVYAAHDLVLDREVAVKMFTGDALDSSLEKRQRAEVRLLARLTHPNLVTLYDAHLATGTHQPRAPNYLVTELVRGSTLSERLTLGPLPEAELIDLGRQLATGLAYVGSAGVIHRDIKPANILLTPEGTAKLVDFGIARLVDSTRLTSLGLTIGTAAYLSPEQVEGTELTPASDIYSLGLVLLECLTGEPAYVGTGVEVAMARLVRAPAIPERCRKPLRQLLGEMLARDPAGRPPAPELAHRLAHLSIPAHPISVATAAVEAPTMPVANPPTRLLQQEPDPAARTRIDAVGIGAVGIEGSSVKGTRSSRRGVAIGCGLAALLFLTVAAVHEQQGSAHNPSAPAPTAAPTGAPGPARLSADLGYLRGEGRP